MRRSGRSSTGFALSCAISEFWARVARSSWAMRSLTADRSSGEPVSRGADLTSLTAAASFSDCPRRPVSSPRNDASDFSTASRRAAAGSGEGAAGLLVLVSRPAIRAARSSTAAALTWSGAGVAGSAGQPSIQPTPITSEAATAPESTAITQGETGADGRSETGAGGACPGTDSGPAPDPDPGPVPEADPGGSPPPALRVSPDTSEASSSMVGGARLGRAASGDGAVSSGLSSTIATVPRVLQPKITRFGRQTFQDSAPKQPEPEP